MLSFINKQKLKSRETIFREMYQEILWILSYIRQYWHIVLFYIVLGICGIGVGFAGTVASKHLIDAVTGHDSDGIGVIIAIMISMAISGILINAVLSRISLRFNIKINNEIQADIYKKIMLTDWEAISKYQSGDLINRLGSDTNIVAGSVIGWLPSLITNIAQFIGTLIIILYYDPTMAIISLMSAPITLIISRILVRQMRSLKKRTRQASSEIMSFLDESCQNIQSIKSLNIIELFYHKFRRVQGTYNDIAMEYNKFSIYTSSFLSIIGLLIYQGTFGWAVYRLWSGYITYGTMIMFLQLSGRLSSGFSALVGMVPSAIEAATSAGRIMAIVDLPRERQIDSDRVNNIDQYTKSCGLRVELRNLCFHYTERDMVLQEVCMLVKPKEIVAIMGASGEGKTTLIRILLGLINPSQGSARLVDINENEVDISSATRKLIAYVPQGNTIFSGSIADNLWMAKPTATEDELICVLKAACAYEFVKELPEGLNTHINENGIGLSEGQAQRLAIARALLRDAPILLLDESTSALDIETEKMVLQSIMAFGRNHTCILTTHRQSVTDICNKVYQIHNTRLIHWEEHQLSRVVNS